MLKAKVNIQVLKVDRRLITLFKPFFRGKEIQSSVMSIFFEILVCMASYGPQIDQSHGDVGLSYFKCFEKGIIWYRIFKKDQAICFYFQPDNIGLNQSIVELYFDYCSIVWEDIRDRLIDKLQKLQNRATRIITGADYLTPTTELLSRLG